MIYRKKCLKVTQSNNIFTFLCWSQSSQQHRQRALNWAVRGGAAAIRANGPANIRAIKLAVNVPVIGLAKVDFPDSPVYITPTGQDVRQVVDTGCDIVAVEATNQPRPNGETIEGFFAGGQSPLSIANDGRCLDAGRGSAGGPTGRGRRRYRLYD